MVASEVRLNARKSLEGKWGKAVLVTLVYMVIMFIIEWLLALVPVIGPIVSLIISIPLGYGLIVTFMDLKRGNEISYFQFFTAGFNAFGNVWKVTLRTLLKMIAPIIVLILSYIIMAAGLGMAAVGSLSLDSSSAATGGILMLLGVVILIIGAIWAAIKYYLYVLSYYILRDNPDMSATEIVDKSAKLMNGNRLKLLCLQLSFIGWAILAAFTFGIGYLWLAPYIAIATIVFYENLSGKVSEEPKKDDQEPEVISEN